MTFEFQNSEEQLARRLIQFTGTNLFLTGRAGTGKTTFLRRLVQDAPKRMIVLAPTGIAAINAGGMTIHSFFQLPFAPYLPGSAFGGKAEYRFQFGAEKQKMMRNSKALTAFDEAIELRMALLKTVREKGFRLSDFLRQKALFSLKKAEGNVHKSRMLRQDASDRTATTSVPVHPELYARLMRWRQEEAVRQGKPPYTILPQKALLGLVRLCPVDERSLLSVSGIGKVTARKYGMELLRIITEFQPDKNRTPGLFPAE